MYNKRFFTVKLWEIQKLGGVCVKYPTSCILKWFLTKYLRLPERALVLDLTYGEGRFWYATNYLVYGVDIKRLAWVKEPFVFIKDSLYNIWGYPDVVSQPFDLVVVDPPFTKHKHRRTHYRVSGSLKEAYNMVLFAIDLAQTLGKPLLVHFREPINWADYGFFLESYSRYASGLLCGWFGLFLW